MIYIARIEDSSENMTRMLVKADGTLNESQHPPPRWRISQSRTRRRFDDFVIRNSGYALTPVTIAANLDKDFPTLHPKQMRRIVIGPSTSAGHHRKQRGDQLDPVAGAQGRKRLAFDLDRAGRDLETGKAGPARLLLFAPAEQIFHIDTNDLEAARMGVTAFEKHALVPHDAYTALYASGEAERVFAGYKVHVISGNQVTDV